ncbi:platelet binding protein GspB-like [Branchiostoma lanceolatum]|uniref:platelet binding protein GspB-like n=1 Tax=Branchiostoma lanceolatum TaxID=7740 RepID=UPI003451CC9B
MEKEDSEAESGDPTMTKLLNYFETMEASGSQSNEVCKYSIMIDSLLETNIKLKTRNRELQDRNKELQQKNEEFQAEIEHLKGSLGKCTCRTTSSSQEEGEEKDKSEAEGSKGVESAVVPSTLSEICPAGSSEAGAQLQEGHEGRKEDGGATPTVPGSPDNPRQVRGGQDVASSEEQDGETVQKQTTRDNCSENHDYNMDEQSETLHNSQMVLINESNDTNDHGQDYPTLSVDSKAIDSIDYDMDGQSSETLHYSQTLNNESKDTNDHSQNNLTLARYSPTGGSIEPPRTERSAFQVVYDMMRELSMQAVSGTLHGASSRLSGNQRLTVDTTGGLGGSAKPAEDNVVVIDLTESVSATQDSCRGDKMEKGRNGCRRSRSRSSSRGRNMASSAQLQDVTPVQEEHQVTGEEESAIANDKVTKTWDQALQTNIQEEDRVVNLTQADCHSTPELSDGAVLCSPEMAAEFTEENRSDHPPKVQTFKRRRRKKARRCGRKPVVKEMSIINGSMSSKDVIQYLQTHHAQEETTFRTDCSGESSTEKREVNPHGMIDAESALRAVMVISDSCTIAEDTDSQVENMDNKGMDSVEELGHTTVTSVGIDNQEEGKHSQTDDLTATDVCLSRSDTVQQGTSVVQSTDTRTQSTDLSVTCQLEQGRCGSKIVSDDTDMDTPPVAPPKRRGRGRPPKKKRTPPKDRSLHVENNESSCRSQVTFGDTDVETAPVGQPKRRGRGRPPGKKRPPVDRSLHGENNTPSVYSRLGSPSKEKTENNEYSICRRPRSLSKEKTEHIEYSISRRPRSLSKEKAVDNEYSISSRLRSRSREKPEERRTELFRSDDEEQEVVRDTASSAVGEDSTSWMSPEVSSLEGIPAFSDSVANENTDNAINADEIRSNGKDSVDEAVHKATTNVDGNDQEEQQVISEETADVCHGHSDAIQEEVLVGSIPGETFQSVGRGTKSKTIDSEHIQEELRIEIPSESTGEISPKLRTSCKPLGKKKYKRRKPPGKSRLFQQLRRRSKERHPEIEAELLPGNDISEQEAPQNTESSSTATGTVSTGITDYMQLPDEMHVTAADELNVSPSDVADEEFWSPSDHDSTEMSFTQDSEEEDKENGDQVLDGGPEETELTSLVDKDSSPTTTSDQEASRKFPDVLARSLEELSSVVGKDSSPPTTTSDREVLKKFPEVLAKSPVVMIKRLEMTSQRTYVCEASCHKDSCNNVQGPLDPEVATTSPSLQESTQGSLPNYPTPETADESETSCHRDSCSSVQEPLDPDVTSPMQESAQGSLLNYPTPKTSDELESLKPKSVENGLCRKVKARKGSRESPVEVESVEPKSMENGLCRKVKARKGSRVSPREKRNYFPKSQGMTRAWTKAEVLTQLREYNTRERSPLRPSERAANEEVHQETTCLIDLESALMAVKVIQNSPLPPEGNSSKKCRSKITQRHTAKHNNKSSTQHEEDHLSHCSAEEDCPSETLAPDVYKDAERRDEVVESPVHVKKEIQNQENVVGTKLGTLKIRVRLRKSRVDGKIRATCIDTAASGGDQKRRRKRNDEKLHVKRKIHNGIAEVQESKETHSEDGRTSNEVQQAGRNASLSKKSSTSLHAQKQKLDCSKEISKGQDKAANAKRKGSEESSESTEDVIKTTSLRQARKLKLAKLKALECKKIYKLRDSSTAEKACGKPATCMANGQTSQSSVKRKELTDSDAVAKQHSGGSLASKTPRSKAGLKEPVGKARVTKVPICDRDGKKQKTHSESILQTTADEQCQKPSTAVTNVERCDSSKERHQEETRRTLGHAPPDLTVENRRKKDFGSALMLADCPIDERATRQVGKKAPSQKSLQPRKKRRMEEKNPSNGRVVEKRRQSVGTGEGQEGGKSTNSKKQSNKPGNPAQDQMQRTVVFSLTGTDSHRGSTSDEQWNTALSGGCTTSSSSKASEDQWWSASSEQRSPTDVADEVFWSPGADDVGAEVEVPFSPVKSQRGKNPGAAQTAREAQLNNAATEEEDSAQSCKKVGPTRRNSTGNKSSTKRKTEQNKSRGQSSVKGKGNLAVKGKDSSTDATPLLSTDSRKQLCPEQSDVGEGQSASPSSSNGTPQFTEAGQKVQVVFTSVQSPAMPASLHGDSPLSPWKRRPPALFSSTNIPRMASLTQEKTPQESQSEKQKAGKRRQAKEKPANKTVRGRRKTFPSTSQEQHTASAAFQESSADQVPDAVSGKDAMNALNCVSLQKTGDSVGSCSQQSNMSFHMQLTPQVKVLGSSRPGTDGGNGSSQMLTQLAEQCYPDPLLTMGCNKVMLENSVRGLQDFGDDNPVVNMNVSLPAVSQIPQLNTTISPTALSLLTFRSEQAIFTNMPLDTVSSLPRAVDNNMTFDTVTSLPDISFTLGVQNALETEETAMQEPSSNIKGQKESAETLKKKKQPSPDNGQMNVSDNARNFMPSGKDIYTATSNSICDIEVPVMPDKSCGDTQQRDAHPLDKIAEVVQHVPTSPTIKRKLRNLVDSPPKEKPTATDKFSPVPVLIDGKEKLPISRLPPGKNAYTHNAVLPDQPLQENALGHNLLVLATASDLVERLWSPTNVDVNRNNCHPTLHEKHTTEINRESARELAAKVSAALSRADDLGHLTVGSSNPQAQVLMAENLTDITAAPGVDEGKTGDILEEAMLQITGSQAEGGASLPKPALTSCTSSSSAAGNQPVDKNPLLNVTASTQPVGSYPPLPVAADSMPVKDSPSVTSANNNKLDNLLLSVGTTTNTSCLFSSVTASMVPVESSPQTLETGKDEFVGRLPAGPPIRTSSRPVDSCTSLPATTANSMSSTATSPVLSNSTITPTMALLTTKKTSQSQSGKQKAGKDTQAKENPAKNTISDRRKSHTDPRTSQEQDIISAAFQEAIADQLPDTVSGSCKEVTAASPVPDKDVFMGHPIPVARVELAESFDSLEVEASDVPEQADCANLKGGADNDAISAEKRKKWPETSSSPKPEKGSTRVHAIVTSEPTEFCDAQSHTTSLDYSPDSDDNWEGMETSDADVHPSCCDTKPLVGNAKKNTEQEEAEHFKRNMDHSNPDICQEPPMKVRRTLLLGKAGTPAGLEDMAKLSVTGAFVGPHRDVDFHTIRQKSPELSDSPVVSNSSNSHSSTQLGSVVEKPSLCNGGATQAEKKTSPGSLASMVQKGNMKLKKLRPPSFLASRTTVGSDVGDVRSRAPTDRPTHLQHGTQQGNGMVQGRDRASSSASHPTFPWVKETDQERIRRLEQEVQTFVKDSSQQQMKVRLTTNDELMKMKHIAARYCIEVALVHGWTILLYKTRKTKIPVQPALQRHR